MRSSSVENRPVSYFLLVWVSLVTVLFATGGAVAAEPSNTISELREIGKAFAKVAEQASPAVVGITTEKKVTQEYSMDRQPFRDPFFEDEFFDYFFRRSPRRRSPQRRQPESRRLAQGSGFIISTDGYILTNNHVVEGADEIKVTVGKDKPIKAELIGTDPESEVALVKIDAENLTALELGDSDALEVGEWVLAIGNPFGLSHTVTAGIVSAKGRKGVGLAAYEDFIQTDAAINPGNSGGPLINLDGKVVGINSAIISRSGGYMGIGLAIPINLAKSVYEQLVESGKVVRGWLGVAIEDLTPEKAPFFKLPENAKGVLISQVFEDSAAEKGGLQRDDVVVELDSQPIEDMNTFRNRVAMQRPGTKVKIVVMRDGKRKALTVKLGEKPSDEQITILGSGASQKLGLTVQNLTGDLAERLGFEGLTGVLVTEVDAGSPAAQAGITPGTLIMEVNRKEVKNTREFSKAVEEVGAGGTVLLYIQDQYYRRFVVLTIPHEQP